MQTSEILRSRRCGACEGDAKPLSTGQTDELLRAVDGWELSDDGRQIRKRWKMEDFSAGMDFLNRVGDLAEQEGHHPDMHLSGYRHVEIALSTHAIGGLSENDFILAAKIDELPAHEKAER